MAREHTPASEMLRDSDMLRSLPVQARSNARLAALLDAAAAVIDREGYETLTTAAVARQAGASIGTVYRYFEDRVLLLNALSLRNFERTSISFRAVLDAKPATVADAIHQLFDANLHLFTHEAGYRSIRMGDVIDIRPREHQPTTRRVAEMIVPLLADAYGIDKNEDTITAVESAYVSIDALLARAFLLVRDGEERFISVARDVAEQLIARLSR